MTPSGLDDNPVVVATKTVVVHDDALEMDRQVVKGQRVPPDLVSAYLAETGEKAEDTPNHESTGEPEGSVIASETVIVHDDAQEIDRQVLKGQAVPPDLVEAYYAKTGESAPKAAPKAKVQPDTSGGDGGNGGDAGTSSTAPKVETRDYSGLKQGELKAELDKRQLDYPKGVGVKNADLVEVLVAADKASAA